MKKLIIIVLMLFCVTQLSAQTVPPWKHIQQSLSQAVASGADSSLGPISSGTFGTLTVTSTATLASAAITNLNAQTFTASLSKSVVVAYPLASTTEVITGVGFAPSSAQLFLGRQNSPYFSTGSADKPGTGSCWYASNTISLDSSNLAHLGDSSSYGGGTITNWGADGVTISWSYHGGVTLSSGEIANMVIVFRR